MPPSIDIAPLDSAVAVEEDPSASCVKVAVRVRPLLPHEAGHTECIDVLQSSADGGPPTSNVVRLGGDSGARFTFDEVFPSTTTQQDVYQNQVAALVASCLEGYNATILAYGQTGSGKTHTIMGPSANITTSVQDELHAGVIPRAIRSIFDQLNAIKDAQIEEESKGRKPSYEFEVRVQFLEVYGDEIRDLLTTQQPNKKLSIRDVGLEEPEVVGATETKVEGAEEALLCLTRGMYRRVTAATAMNQSSSRSHAILSLIVEQSAILDREDASPKSAANKNSLEQHVQAKRSKFNFVDLAGSERQKKTMASGQRLKEGININQGLLVLGNVISALGDPKKRGKTFVPYRNSKLTRLLKGSLGGNHKTLMIACVSPSASNLEESLNCLRYANRAKNIQNHAVVNLDATSRLVGELRGKLQLLAADLLKVRDGNLETCSIPLEVVQALAKGGDGEGISSEKAFAQGHLHPALSPFSKGTITPTKRPLQVDMDHTELQRIKAENEALRIRIQNQATNDDQKKEVDALQMAFMNKVVEYERQIFELRTPGPETRGEASERQNRSVRRTPSHSESPELNRLRAQIFGSMAQPKNLEAEVEAEENAVKLLTNKYLGQTDEIDEDGPVNAMSPHPVATSEDFAVKLEAEIFELSTSITAKEDLIQKLQVSQEKYEAMREFYEEKLKEMSILLTEKEKETTKLSEELKKLDTNHSSSKELKERLEQKKAQLLELRKKQTELSRLTSVASKNESQISKLKREVVDTKHKKVELQKEIAEERKNHALEVQKLKKEAIQKDKELSKVKRAKDQKTVEAERAQQVAKSRLEQVKQLKTKYKETEKRLRMQTIKRGVMSKAGLDPLMVGRRHTKKGNTGGQGMEDGSASDSVMIDALRDFFDQRIADVSRREALAEKLAQEWEEHLDLSSQRDDLAQTPTVENMDEIEGLNSQIKYKEDRIRQLASRLGKRKRGAEEKEGVKDEGFLFGNNFQDLIGDAAPAQAVKLAAKILFGMVVRERRRTASLARTASSLDEKVQEAESAAAAKDAAFRAYVDEQRLDAAEQAQNQQQHILSLMEMVREHPQEEISADNVSSPVRSAKARHAEKANSKLLLLANERIAVLEQQLHETNLGREAIQKHREREDEAQQLLAEKIKECEILEEELNDLRAALRQIREEVNHSSANFQEQDWNNSDFGSSTILDIVQSSLHPSGQTGDGGKTKRRRRSILSTDILESPKRSIRRQAELIDTSDSDEVPDWADDIMKDLAIIAEGRMPSSLMESSDVMDIDEKSQDENVFDRLTNPKSFTGVQKQKQIPSRKDRSSAESAADGQRQRKLISKQVADSLDKLVIPGPEPIAEPSSKKEKALSKADMKKRSVFDRLVSPSNLTGTQRQRFQDKKGKNDHSAATALDMALEESLGADSDHARPPRESHDELNSTVSSLGVQSHDSKKTASSKGQATKKNEYKDLDVFERLNKTTTQAYAVKQHVNLAEKMLDDLLDDDDGIENEEQPKTEPHFERVEAYAQQNVFERLNKTTTRAYDKKRGAQASTVDGKSGHQDQSDERVPGGAEGEQDKTASDPFSPISSRLRTRR